MADVGAAQGAQQIQKATVSQNTGSRLHDGSLVQARVLSDRGGGSFVISVAGRQLAVRSSLPLVPGQTLTAQIQLRGSEVALVLQGGNPVIPEAPALQTLLSALGLPQTGEAARLLAFAQELGIKLKAAQLKKALLLAEGFSDREEAAELSLLLADKGLRSDGEAVLALLDGSGQGHGRKQGGREPGSGGSSSQGGRRQGHKEEDGAADFEPGTGPAGSASAASDSAEDLPPDGDVIYEAICAGPRAFFNLYAQSADAAAVSQAPGALTACNLLFRRRAPEDASLHWIQLPFDWPLRSSSGMIRILWDADKKRVCKITVSEKKDMAEKRVMVYYNAGAMERVEVSSFPPVPEERRAALLQQLEQALAACTGKPVAAAYSQEPV